MFLFLYLNYSYSVVPLVVPSVLEHYQTALRDPAFYMIWKRVLGLFKLWQEKLPPYKREELALPQVAIQQVDVDKLVTFFEYNYFNVSSYLHMNEEEGNLFYSYSDISGKVNILCSLFSYTLYFLQPRNCTTK